MQDLLDQILDHLSGIWRYRWIALFGAWVIAIGGWGGVALMEDKYLATARVHVDTNSVLAPLLKGLAIQPDVRQRVALMGKTLLSRPNMEKLIRMVDLDLGVNTDEEKEKLLTKLQETIQLKGSRHKTSIYTLSFVHADRTIAKRVVQSLISILIEGTLGDKRQDSAGAQEFLDKQIADYEVRLAEAEGRLADFKRRYAGSMPGDAGGYYQRLELAHATLRSAQLELRETKNRRDALAKQLAREKRRVVDTPGTVEAPAVSRLADRIKGLQEQLDQLLLKYTDRHPDVIELKAVLEDLEAKKKVEQEEAKKEQARNPQKVMQESDAYQEIRAMLAETEGRVAELGIRVGEFTKRAKELEGKVDQIPLIEAELQQLNRDYEAISLQHKQLLKRRESALLSEKAEQESTNVNFRVIDPPFVPQRPTEPNKLLLNIGILIVAIGGAAGGALLLSLLRPVFGNRRSLGRVTGLPVLGVVTLLAAPAQRQKNLFSGVIYFSLVLLLMVSFAGVLYVEGANIELVEKLQYLDLMGKFESLKARFL